VRDITRPAILYLKAACFLVVGVVASTLLLLESPRLSTIVLLLVAIWSFARLYYFAFYVIERYVDPSYRFSGIGSFLRHLVRVGLER
jgi:hypothetical protein